MSDQEALTAKTHVEDDACVVALQGEIDPSTAPKLEGELHAARFTSDCDRMIIDMSEVTFCDSSGLRVLISFHKTLREQDGSLVVRHPSATIRQLLEVTALTDVFGIE